MTEHFGRFSVVPPKENSNGVKINGTWNGLIGQIYRGVLDIFANLIENKN